MYAFRLHVLYMNAIHIYFSCLWSLVAIAILLFRFDLIKILFNIQQIHTYSRECANDLFHYLYLFSSKLHSNERMKTTTTQIDSDSAFFDKRKSLFLTHTFCFDEKLFYLVKMSFNTFRWDFVHHTFLR